MKKIILSTSIALLLMTNISYADTKTSEQIKVEKDYQQKMDKANKVLDNANDALSKNYKRHGMFHSTVAEDYKVISEAYFTLGKLDESIDYSLHALKVEMKLQKENNPSLAKLYFDTGNKYYMHKQHPTAILYMKKALEIYKNSPEKDPLVISDIYESIASVYINLEDYQKSLDYEDKCLSIRQKHLKKDNESLKRAQMNIKYLNEELQKNKNKVQ